MHRSLKWRLLLGAFLEDFILIYPFYQLMMLAQGVNIAQISGLFILWSLVSIVAEIPTGVLADRIPRRYLLVTAQILRAAGFGVWLVWPDWWGYATGFVLWGISGAFHSGTYQAFVYDELAAVGQSQRYTWWQGRLNALTELGLMLCAFAGAAAIQWGYDGVGYISIAVGLITAGLYATLPSAPPREQLADTGYWHELKVGVGEALRTPTILRLAILGAVVGSVYGVMEEYTPVYAAIPGLELWQISLLEGIIGVAVIGGSLVAHRLQAVGDKGFAWLLALAGLALIAAAAPWRIPGFGAVMLGFGLLKLLEVAYDARLQHEISSHRRATITSVSGFILEILSIGLYGFFGLLAQLYGTLTAFGWIGGGVTIVGLLYIGKKFRDK